MAHIVMTIVGLLGLLGVPADPGSHEGGLLEHLGNGIARVPPK